MSRGMPSPDQDWKEQAPTGVATQAAAKRPANQKKNEQSWGNWLSEKAQQAKQAVDESGYVELAQQKAQAVKESVGPALSHAVSQLEVPPGEKVIPLPRENAPPHFYCCRLSSMALFLRSAGAQQRTRSSVERSPGEGETTTAA